MRAGGNFIGHSVKHPNNKSQRARSNDVHPVDVHPVLDRESTRRAVSRALERGVSCTIDHPELVAVDWHGIHGS